MRLPTTQGRRLQLLFWVGIGLGAIALVVLGRVRPSWPWFSLWLMVLLGSFVVLALPPVRAALNLSWFRVTLLTLTGVCLFNLFLFQVETHRQRSERLEVQGVYFGANQRAIRVGVGWAGLDARLEGSLYDFDRWSLELREEGGNRFVVQNVRQVDMLRVRGRGWRSRFAASTSPALGVELNGRHPEVSRVLQGGDTLRFELEREGPRGTLKWGRATAPLSGAGPLLDRRLSRRLGVGIPVAELDWDSVPSPEAIADLVLTRVRGGRSLGRMRLTLPGYRLVSRSDPEAWEGGGSPVLEAGDTLWVTSRGKTWAFAVGRAPGVSRVAAPVAVTFVRRPRPAGWALPSPEACGRDSDRCAVLSTRSLSPPQAHFDLSGYGLDTARYGILARLETGPEEVRLVGAREVVAFPYGEIQPVEALPTEDDAAGAGVLVKVHRADRGQLGDVFLTVLGLYLLMVGTLLVLSGDPRLWRLRKGGSRHVAAAWGLLNVFLIFMGIRLALGLRVAYTPPFYDRAAATAVGLWVTFALLAVALGRWSSWLPGFWRLARNLQRPLSRVFLPGLNDGSRDGRSTTKFTLVHDETESPEAQVRARRARARTRYGLLLFVPTLGALLWQRPSTAASLLVALAGLGAWLAMGLARRPGSHWPLSAYPLRVLTADAEMENPSLAFAIAAGASVVLALAIHAPAVALVPVVALLWFYAVDHLLSRTAGMEDPSRRGWAVYGILFALSLGAVGAFAGQPLMGAGGTAVLFGAVAWWLRATPKPEGESRLSSLYRGFLDVQRAVLSGPGWIGVVLVLTTLVFLNTREIPPFVRFALVFTLFLLAIRAGLSCNRVLHQGGVKGRVEALGLLVIPLGVLFVFMLFDFGLGLVFFAPMFVTVLLAARIDRLPAPLVLAAGAMLAATSLVAWSVLRPSLVELRGAPDLGSFSVEYEEVGNRMVDALRHFGVGGAITRATVRSMAASDPALLEEAMAFAGPSEALFAAAPSIEQVWGGRAYAASGWTGTGFAGTTPLGRGIPTAVSYAENAFSVYVLSEHGALGGLAVLAVYLALLVVVAVWITGVHGTIQNSPPGLAVLAMTVGGVLWLVLPAAYVAASNLAVVPLTGQNMPFLGLNSWADVVLVTGLATGMLFGLTALDAVEKEAS
jgi:hypothetical protein